MKELVCTTERKESYTILLERGLSKHIYELGHIFSKYKKIVIISDKNVAKHYLSRVRKQLRSFDSEVITIIIAPGENSKNLAQAEEIFYKLQETKVTRVDAIVALGGGVVGDLAGFCAANYLRGIDFIQIPTSLLAQVDSSIGGKVGVDLGYAKNIVGAFYQPKSVIVDPDLLETLEDHYLTDGMGEVIKYACISSTRLFVRLMAYEYHEDLMADMEEIVGKCIQIKRNVVEKDEKEQGLRRVLNFGHTIGHVIESYFEFEEYSHGEAVAIGMYNITKMSVQEGLTKPETLTNMRILLENFGLAYEMPEMDIDRVKEILMNDKKFEDDILNVCIIPEIGKSEIVKIHKKQAIKLFS